MKKIIFIIDQVYMHGGIENVLSIKSNYLSNLKNYDIYIITTEQYGKKPCYEFNSKITFIDLKINYQRNKSYFHPINLIKLPLHILKINNTLKKINPSCVVVCSHSTDTYFIPFIKQKIPKIKEFHFSKAIEDIHRLKHGISKKKTFLKFADYVQSKYDSLVVLNSDEANYFKTDNTTIIPNPLTFYPKKTSLLNNPIAITAGRIAHVKRYDVLIDIWELVNKQNKLWKLYIYGTGEKEYLELLQKKIEDKNLIKHVFLKGPTNQIKNKMLKSSLFLMTSDNECFPLVLLEAQACGLPIISYDCPNGPRHIIKKNTGKLIKPQDQIGFSEAILKMLESNSYRKYFGENARLNSSNYKLDNIMALWLTLFNTVNKNNENNYI